MVSPLSHFFWHFQLALHVHLIFHLGQPHVSETRKSYTCLLLICWQVCRLAHNAMAPYQKQPCLGLIFLAPTSHYLSYSSDHGSHHSLIHSFIPLACAECDDSMPFSGSSSIPHSYVLIPATLLQQLFFHPLTPHLAICFLVYLSILLFPNSYIIPFWEFYFLPFSIHAQTNVIYLTLLSLL